MKKVFVTRQIPDIGLDRLRQACEVEVWEEELPPPDEVLQEAIGRVDGLLCMLTDKIDAALIAKAAPDLHVISQYAVGVDNIDLKAATKKAIAVGHTPDVLTEATADLAFALLMAAARRLNEAAQFVYEANWRTWSPTAFIGQDVYGATLGIIGMGRIGQAVAKRARGFDMRVVYHSRSAVTLPEGLDAEALSLDELLTQADFVSLHAPLTLETTHLIDAWALRLMKPNAILVNTARGGLVDHQALLAALKSGQIAGAALDVTEPEPIPDNAPLLDLPNCLIVPHIGSASVRARQRMAKMAVDNLLAGLEGRRLPYCANPEVYG